MLGFSDSLWHPAELETNLSNVATREHGNLKSHVSHTSPVTRLCETLPTITQPEHFQHSDNHFPQIALTLSQLAGGNLPEMSSAVMSWLNGVGEMATYIMPVRHAAGEAVHLVPWPKKAFWKMLSGGFNYMLFLQPVPWCCTCVVSDTLLLSASVFRPSCV